MDDWWYDMGGSCFGLFPPSFYYTHSEEEIACITEETLAKLQDMVDELASVPSHKRKLQKKGV